MSTNKPTLFDFDPAFKIDFGEVELKLAATGAFDQFLLKGGPVEELTPELIADHQQAIDEFDATYIPLEPKPGPVVNKRKREGIQLCKVYDPAKPPKWEEAFFEPKRNGYRCITLVQNGKAELLTSTGLPHWNVDHIRAELEKAAVLYPATCDNTMLDGEVMHDSLDFDTAGGILRKHEPDERSLGFYYHVWDCMGADEFIKKECSRPLVNRKMILGLTILSIKESGSIYVSLNPSFRGKLSEIVEYAKKFVIEMGEEGVVAKDVQGLYQFRKSGVWLKWKPKFLEDGLIQNMHDADMTIIGAVEGRGKHKGKLGALKIFGYLYDDGNIGTEPPYDGAEEAITVTSEAGTGFTDAQRTEMWQWHLDGTLNGRVVEIKYENVTKDYSLHHPVFFRMRPDKEA